MDNRPLLRPTLIATSLMGLLLAACGPGDDEDLLLEDEDGRSVAATKDQAGLRCLARGAGHYYCQARAGGSTGAAYDLYRCTSRSASVRLQPWLWGKSCDARGRVIAPSVSRSADPPAADAGSAYAPVSGSLFVGGPEVGDPIQGGLGDCGVIAAFAALALTDPATIEAAIAPHRDGGWDVSLYAPWGGSHYVSEGQNPVYEWITVPLDADLPVEGQNPRYGHGQQPGELWVPLMEKAIAKYRGDYSSLSGFNAIGVFWLLSGRQPEAHQPQTKDEVDGLLDRVFPATGKRGAVVLNTLRDAGRLAGSGLIDAHAYALWSVQRSGSKRVLTLRNPQNVDPVHIDSADVPRYFANIEVLAP